MIHNQFMKQNILKDFFFFSIKTLTFVFFLFSSSYAVDSKYFIEGKKLFNKNEVEKSKVFFEKDIVFNPKNDTSYLYLAKIFHSNKNDKEEEKNLDTVLLIDPQNPEAIYMLTLLKIKQSDYSSAKDLIGKYSLYCKKECSKKDELDKKFSKLTP